MQFLLQFSQSTNWAMYFHSPDNNRCIFLCSGKKIATKRESTVQFSIWKSWIEREKERAEQNKIRTRNIYYTQFKCNTKYKKKTEWVLHTTPFCRFNKHADRMLHTHTHIYKIKAWAHALVCPITNHNHSINRHFWIQL